jgi:hypothetical protein
MSNDLLSSDIDVFFFNTKTVQDYSTKVAFLSGTGSYLLSPYIKSNPTGTHSDFILGNPNGNISVLSDSGVVQINGLSMPTYDTNQNAA